MAFLPSLQEPAQPNAKPEFLPIYGRENISSSISLTSQDTIHLESFLPLDYVSRESDSDDAFKSVGLSNVPVQYKAPTYDFMGGDSLKTWSNTLAMITCFDFSRSSTFYSFESTAWKAFCTLDLSLYDLSIVKQTQKVRNALVHYLPFLTTAFSSELSHAQTLEELYLFRRQQEVRQFLEENSFLEQFLIDAYSNIKKYFAHSDFLLEVIADSEAIDEKQLVLFIIVEGEPDIASLALDKLDEDWWLDAMDYTKDKLCIALEFK